MPKQFRTSSITINIFMALFLIIGGFVFPSPVHADSTITVATNIASINNGDGLCSLPEAITNANNNAQTYSDCVIGSANDTIQFNDALGATTILLNSTLPHITDTNGLTINGGGDITIDGNNIYRIFFVDPSVPFSLNGLILTNGECTSCSGGTVFNTNGTLTITNTTISNSDTAIYNDSGILTITNSTFSGNNGFLGGGIANSGTLTVTSSIFSGNSSDSNGGSGIYNLGTAAITKSTFSNNISTNHARGVIYNVGTMTISNSTFFGNNTTGGGCCNGAGAVYNQATMTIINSTFSGNGTTTIGGAADIYQLGTTSALHLYNNILANSIGEQNCRLDASSGTVNGNNNLIESHIGCPTTSPLITDPNLGTLTGSPSYFPLNVGSPAINAGDDTICAAAPVNNTSQNGVARPQGAHCDIGAYESVQIADNVQLSIGETLMGSYGVPIGTNVRPSYADVNNGPVKVVGLASLPIITSERVAYTPDGGATWTSFDEMMGLPSNQLTDTYYFPFYNNVEMNTQLRFGNVGTSSTNVTVIIGGIVQGVYPLAPNQSMRLSYNLNSGPVKVQSSGNVPIIASIRFANIESTSPLVVSAFTEMMGLPGNQLTSTYIFPYYNNVEMNTQLRFGNVGTSATNVTVTIGGVVQGVYPVAPSQSVRLSYNLNSGPVKVQSSGGVPIIASMRFAKIQSESPLVISYFSEMLGLPQASLSTNYWFPIYDNVTHNMQLRFGNMGTTSTTVTVRIGGVEQGSYVVLPNQSQRLFYTLNDGPVQVQSSGGVPIIASIRFAYIESESPLVIGAFSEMLGLPAAQLSSTYLFPWYNNEELDTQMRIAVP